MYVYIYIYIYIYIHPNYISSNPSKPYSWINDFDQFDDSRHLYDYPPLWLRAFWTQQVPKKLCWEVQFSYLGVLWTNRPCYKGYTNQDWFNGYFQDPKISNIEVLWLYKAIFLGWYSQKFGLKKVGHRKPWQIRRQSVASWNGNWYCGCNEPKKNWWRYNNQQQTAICQELAWENYRMRLPR